jgi:NTE family protein
MIGALTALEEVTGTDAREFDVIVGTSAGAVVAALLGGDVDVATLRDHQRGAEIDGPLAGHQWDHDTATGGALPARPHFGFGSPGMITRNIRRFRRMPPTALLSGLVPEGRGSLRRVGELIEAVAPHGEWVSRDGVWILALDYETGRRVPFGRPGEMVVGLSDAVMASCAIPGWFAPVSIDGHRFIDGGSWSATSADVLAGLELSEVYVVAPMVSYDYDHPGRLVTKVERRWRARVTRRCEREVDQLRAEGTQTTVIGPGAVDLEAIGANVMDVSRRLDVLDTSMRTSAVALSRALATERSSDPPEEPHGQSQVVQAG